MATYKQSIKIVRNVDNLIYGNEENRLTFNAVANYSIKDVETALEEMAIEMNAELVYSQLISALFENPKLAEEFLIQNYHLSTLIDSYKEALLYEFQQFNLRKFEFFLELQFEDCLLNELKYYELTASFKHTFFLTLNKKDECLITVTFEDPDPNYKYTPCEYDFFVEEAIKELYKKNTLFDKMSDFDTFYKLYLMNLEPKLQLRKTFLIKLIGGD